MLKFIQFKKTERRLVMIIMCSFSHESVIVLSKVRKRHIIIHKTHMCFSLKMQYYRQHLSLKRDIQLYFLLLCVRDLHCKIVLLNLIVFAHKFFICNFLPDFIILVILSANNVYSSSSLALFVCSTV